MEDELIMSQSHMTHYIFIKSDHIVFVRTYRLYIDFFHGHCEWKSWLVKEDVKCRGWCCAVCEYIMYVHCPVTIYWGTGAMGLCIWFFSQWQWSFLPGDWSKNINVVIVWYFKFFVSVFLLLWFLFFLYDLYYTYIHAHASNLRTSPQLWTCICTGTHMYTLKCMHSSGTTYIYCRWTPPHSWAGTSGCSFQGYSSSWGRGSPKYYKQPVSSPWRWLPFAWCMQDCHTLSEAALVVLCGFCFTLQVALDCAPWHPGTQWQGASQNPFT